MRELLVGMPTEFKICAMKACVGTEGAMLPECLTMSKRWHAANTAAKPWREQEFTATVLEKG